MAKRMLTRASTQLLAGAEATARNGITFAFTCKTLSDGSPATVYANVRITNSGDVNVCDYEVRRGETPDMDEEASVQFSDSDTGDEGTLEGYSLPDFVSRAQ